MVDLRLGSDLRQASRPVRGGEAAWRRVDWLLAVSALALALIGSLLVWAATKQRELDSGGDPRAYLKRHLINLVIGPHLTRGV